MKDDSQDNFDTLPYTKASYKDNKGNSHQVSFIGSLSYCNACVVSMTGTLYTELVTTCIAIAMCIFVLLSKFNLFYVKGVNGVDLRVTLAEFSTVMLIVVAVNSMVRMPDDINEDGSFSRGLQVFWAATILSGILDFIGLDVLSSWVVIVLPFILLYHAVTQLSNFSMYSLILQQTEAQELYGDEAGNEDE